MLNRSGLTLSFCILSAFAGTVSADVIPFEVEEAEIRILKPMNVAISIV